MRQRETGACIRIVLDLKTPDRSGNSPSEFERLDSRPLRRSCFVWLLHCFLRRFTLRNTRGACRGKATSIASIPAAFRTWGDQAGKLQRVCRSSGPAITRFPQKHRAPGSRDYSQQVHLFPANRRKNRLTAPCAPPRGEDRTQTRSVLRRAPAR
jgi:hypothetical protein